MIDFTKTFLKHRFILVAGIIFAFGFINTWLDSVSTLADFKRSGVDISAWEPYVWEFSSFIVGFILVLYIVKAESWHSFTYGKFKKHLFYHLLHSILYSLIHVVGMVLIREFIYQLMDGNYNFGNWSTELFYEYRKDGMSYFKILAGIYIYQYIIKTIEGDAHLIAEKNNSDDKPDKLLIKKKGKEFVVSLNQISTIESGGNYIYIHTNNQVYPMRSTMNKMQEKLDPKHFIRVHRSYIVNSNFIQEILTINPQEYKIKLKNNVVIPLSRNNRSELLKVFHV